MREESQQEKKTRQIDNYLETLQRVQEYIQEYTSYTAYLVQQHHPEHSVLNCLYFLRQCCEEELYRSYEQQFFLLLSGKEELKQITLLMIRDIETYALEMIEKRNTVVLYALEGKMAICAYWLLRSEAYEYLQEYHTLSIRLFRSTFFT